VIVLIHLNILLGFLIPSIVYAKRGIEYVSDEHDDQTEGELDDMTKTKAKIKDLIDRGVIE
jgi:hypothetical protein